MPDDKQGFFAKLKALYREMYDDYQVPYRLVEFTEHKNTKMAVIGLRHSHYTFKTPVSKAVSDKALLDGLSHQDVRSLAMYAVYCEMQPQYEFVCIDYIATDNWFITVKDKLTNNEIRLTKEEFNQCTHIIDRLGSKDAFKLGYLCGNKQRNNP